MSKDNQIAALLHERLGYTRRNLPKRVALVDAMLGALGYVHPETATLESKAERAVTPKARKRSK